MATSFHLKNNTNESVELLEENEEIFQWTKQWYPVAVAKFLDPSRPHPLQLLGKELVLWRDGNSKWRCFEDFCPHRLAPLSEGRVESDGTLLCPYHAWRFDSDGRCVSIPQSKDKEIEAKNCSNHKSCALTYPIVENRGLLWVWPESGQKAWHESQLRPARTIPELENHSDITLEVCWSVRDLPYGWDFFMENLSDPAHVPVSHHGLTGNRYKDARYYDMIRVREISTQEGFAFEVTPTAADDVKQTVHDFQPPCLMRITNTYEDGSKIILVLYTIPTRPGWCRHISCNVYMKNEEGKWPKGPAALMNRFPRPAWLLHPLLSLLLHQDLVLLHHQEKIVAKKVKGKWLNSVYTPNPQDKMVIALRQWLDKRAGGGISWVPECSPELPPAERDKQKLFDVWTTHTQHCMVCQNALKNINRICNFTYIASIACLCLGIMIDARAFIRQTTLENAGQMSASVSNLLVAPNLGFWLALGSGLLFASMGYLLKKFSRLYYVYVFEHAHND